MGKLICLLVHIYSLVVFMIALLKTILTQTFQLYILNKNWKLKILYKDWKLSGGDSEVMQLWCSLLAV